MVIETQTNVPIKPTLYPRNKYRDMEGIYHETLIIESSKQSILFVSSKEKC